MNIVDVGLRFLMLSCGRKFRLAHLFRVCGLARIADGTGREPVSLEGAIPFIPTTLNGNNSYQKDCVIAVMGYIYWYEFEIYQRNVGETSDGIKNHERSISPVRIEANGWWTLPHQKANKEI